MHLPGFHQPALRHGPEQGAGTRVIHLHSQRKRTGASAAAVHVVIDVPPDHHFRAALAGQGYGAGGFVRRALRRILKGLKGIERKPDLPDLPRKHLAEAHGIGYLLRGTQGYEQGAGSPPQNHLRRHVNGRRLTAHKVVYLKLKRRAEIASDAHRPVAVVWRRRAAAEECKQKRCQNCSCDQRQRKRPALARPRAAQATKPDIQMVHCVFSEARHAFCMESSSFSLACARLSCRSRRFSAGMVQNEVWRVICTRLRISRSS